MVQDYSIIILKYNFCHFFIDSLYELVAAGFIKKLIIIFLDFFKLFFLIIFLKVLWS
jgi:hypothetical protein